MTLVVNVLKIIFCHSMERMKSKEEICLAHLDQEIEEKDLSR